MQIHVLMKCVIKNYYIYCLVDILTFTLLQKSYQQPIAPEFQKKYANIVLELENLNKDLNEYLIGVQQYCQEVRSFNLFMGFKVE